MILHTSGPSQHQTGMDDCEIDRLYAKAFDQLAEGNMPSTASAMLANIYECIRISREQEEIAVAHELLRTCRDTIARLLVENSIHDEDALRLVDEVSRMFDDEAGGEG